MRIYIGGLSGALAMIKDHELKSLFSAFGDINFVDVKRDTSGKSIGFGFIEYKITDDAKKAINEMNGYELNG